MKHQNQFGICLIVVGVSLFTAAPALSQCNPQTTNGEFCAPPLGTVPNGFYEISKIETIDAVTGNVSLHIPITSLPSGRGGFSQALDLFYNSTIYTVQSNVAADGTVSEQLIWSNLWNPTDSGGWHYGFNYVFTFDVEQNQTTTCSSDEVISYRYRIVLPDGSSHTLFHLPRNQTDYDSYGYYNYQYNGCNPPSNMPYVFEPNNVDFYTADGTYLRVVWNGSTGNWTLYYPDGRQVQYCGTTSTSLVSPCKELNETVIMDRNLNHVFVDNAMPNGTTATTLTDDVGRTITIQQHYPQDAPGTDTITQTGYNDGVQSPLLTWYVKWATISLAGGQSYICNSSGNPCSAGSLSQTVVSEIDLPQTEDGSLLKYYFCYQEGVTCPNNPTLITSLTGRNSWGQLSYMVLPSSAQVNYQFLSSPNISTYGPVLPVSSKILTWTDDADGSVRTEQSNYTFTVVSSIFQNPDGGQITHYFYNTTDPINVPLAGSVYEVDQPNGDKLERVWGQNIPYSGGTQYGVHLPGNPYVQYELKSFGNVGSAVPASATAYTVDRNGNQMNIAEWDCLNQTNCTFNHSGGLPTGFSGGTNVRTTQNTYVYAAGTATSDGDSTNDSYGYWNMFSGQIFGLLAIRAVGGSSTQFIYDNDSNTYGNITAEYDWDSGSNQWLTISHTYDTYGGFASACPYSIAGPHGNLTSTTNPNGFTTIYCYDQNMLYVIKRVEAYGTADARTFTYAYDPTVSTSLLISETDSDHSVTDTYSYDPIGRNTSIQENGVRTTTVQYYDQARNVVVKSDLNANGDGLLPRTTFYDQLGRVWLTQDWSGSYVQRRYLTPQNSSMNYELASNPYVASGNPVSPQTDPTMGWTLTTKDTVGRISTVQHFSGATLPSPWPGTNPNSTGTASYNYAANTTTFIDEAGSQWSRVTDGLGRLIQVTESAINSTTTYGYDALDDLISVLSATGQRRSFSYSTLRRLLSATNPESGMVKYTYDGDGNLLTRTDARNIVTTYCQNGNTNLCYNGLDQPLGKTYTNDPSSTPNVSYAYNKGWMTQVQAGTYSYNYTGWDGIGRVTSSYQAIGSQSYPFTVEYKPVVGVEWIQYPNSQRVLTATYDGTGRVVSLSGQITPYPATDYAGNSQAPVLYTPNDQIKSITLGNGIVETRGYNSRLQPQSVQAGSLLSLQYGYSATQNNGNVLTQQIAWGADTWTQSYGYTEAAPSSGSINRLTCASEVAGTTAVSCGTGSPQWSQIFGYDGVGNLWLTESGNLPGLTVETPQAQGWYSANNQISGWFYDCAGNILGISSTGPTVPCNTTPTGLLLRTATYDAENRMITATMNGQTTTYAYDGLGDRVQKSVNGVTTAYVYDPFGHLVQEYGPPPPAGTPPTEYLIADALGSTRLVMDGSGNCQGAYDYLPFGQEIPINYAGRTFNCYAGQSYPSLSGLTTLKFTGKERDSESDLDNFRARYYSSQSGRFMSPDPLGGHLFDPQTLNKYSYVRNNPLSFTDPTGLDFYLTCTHVQNNQQDNSDTCQEVDNGGQKVSVQGTTTNGQFSATVISNGANGTLVDQNGNQYSGTFDQNGVAFTSSSGVTTSGVFENGSNPTTLSGAGIFQGFTGVFNDNCGGTCVASGSIFGTTDQFNALKSQLLHNPGIDAVDLFHHTFFGLGPQNYREGNVMGPDPHLVSRGGTENSGYDQFHYDGSYPYATVPGFFSHAGSVFSSIAHIFTGPQSLQPPTTIP